MEDYLFSKEEMKKCIDKNFLKLKDRFIVPPFSILDTKQGYWLERKNKWISLGIKSEEGRGENLLKFSDTILQPDPEKRNLAKAYNAHDWMESKGIKNVNSAGGTSIFDPVLAELCYKWFCIKGGTILDPFAGGSVRGIVAAISGYKYYGIDLSDNQIKANIVQANDIIKEGEKPEWKSGNSLNIDSIFPGIEADFIFSCPPYFNLEKYSDLEDDLSNMTWEDFKSNYSKIIIRICERLKNNRFACFVVGDIRDKKGFYRNFIELTKHCFFNAGCFFYNDIVLVNSVGSLAIRINRQFNGYRKVGKMHQNVLVFFKGNPKTIKDNFEIMEMEGI